MEIMVPPILAVGKDTIPQVISLQPLLVKVCNNCSRNTCMGKCVLKKMRKKSNDYTQYLTKVNVCL